MKKLIVLMMAVLVCSLGTVAMAANDVIAVTVSLDAIYEVSLVPDVWDIGAQALDYVSSFTEFTAEVGNIATKLQIKAANGDGAWTLGTVGSDEFRLECEAPALELTTEDQVLDASVAAYNTQTFALKYYMPSADTIGATTAQGFDVTITAGAVD